MKKWGEGELATYDDIIPRVLCGRGWLPIQMYHEYLKEEQVRRSLQIEGTTQKSLQAEIICWWSFLLYNYFNKLLASVPLVTALFVKHGSWWDRSVFVDWFV